ncbi:hypothetical protein Barb7_03075 [Bacteroidales bacterium Barb7]|nr:hypothetical protein Barb7_03075 [Bacteroidales bacterium Barb7]
MTGTVKEIEDGIIERLTVVFTLSTSVVAEWRLWVNVFATVMHAFELILDKFESDMQATKRDEGGQIAPLFSIQKISVTDVTQIPWESLKLPFSKLITFEQV